MKYQKYIDLFRKKHMLLLTGEPDMELDIIAQDIAAQMILGRDWRKRSIPTHSEWLYPLTFDAGKGLKEA